MGYINNKLLWARKYARIVVRGYYLFREANSCPRAKLEGDCELRGTDNVQGQLSVHISEAKSSLLSLLSFKYFLSQRKQRRLDLPSKTFTAKHVDFFVLSGTAFSTSLLISSLVIDEKLSISTFVRQAGVIGCERTLSADNVRSRADVIGSRVTIPPITRERKYLMGYNTKYRDLPVSRIPSQLPLPSASASN